MKIINKIIFFIFSIDSFSESFTDITSEVKLESVSGKEEKEYIFSDNGKSDPFIPIQKEKKNDFESSNTNIYQKHFVADLKMTGSLKKSSDSERKALILTPDGESLVVKKGEKLGRNGGYILDIDENKIIVREPNKNDTGETNFLDTQISISQEEISILSNEKKTDKKNNEVRQP